MKGGIEELKQKYPDDYETFKKISDAYASANIPLAKELIEELNTLEQESLQRYLKDLKLIRPNSFTAGYNAEKGANQARGKNTVDAKDMEKSPVKPKYKDKKGCQLS